MNRNFKISKLGLLSVNFRWKVSIFLALLGFPLVAIAGADFVAHMGEDINVRTDLLAKDESNNSVCIPRGTQVIVISVDADANNKTNTITVGLNHLYGSVAASCRGVPSIPDDRGARYTFLDTEIGSSYFSYGATGGILAIPFKFQTHDHSLTATPSFAGYFGERGYWYGTELTLATFMGLGFATLTQAQQQGSGSTSTTSTSAGITYGLAVIGKLPLSKSFQWGLVVGQDRMGTNTSTPYPYEGKWWWSIAFNYPFAQSQ
jgi:hypothetical protein